MYLIDLRTKKIINHTESGLLFDTHCHLDFPSLHNDLATYLAKAKQAGVEACIIPAVNESNWQVVSKLVKRYPSYLYAAFGYHPLFLPSDIQPAVQRLEQFMTHTEIGDVVAIGEIGLDRFAAVPFDSQLAIFQSQLSLAKSLSLPVIIHSRKTHSEVLKALKQSNSSFSGVIHGFSGSYEQAKAFVDLGYKIGVGGTITYPRANKTRQAIQRLSMDDIVLETDAPDMPVCGFQGQINHPAQLTHVVTTLCELYQCERDEVAQRTWRSATALFLSGQFFAGK